MFLFLFINFGLCVARLYKIYEEHLESNLISLKKLCQEYGVCNEMKRRTPAVNIVRCVYY